MAKKSLLLFMPFLFLLFYFNCAQYITNDPTIHTQLKNSLALADDLLSKGDYISLRKAFHIYKETLLAPHFTEAVKEKLLKTSLLLTLRTKELGIVENLYLQEAHELIQRFPGLKKFTTAYKSIYVTPIDSKGIMGSYLDDDNLATIEQLYDWINENVEHVAGELRQQAETDDFFAYCYISFRFHYPYWQDEDANLERFLTLYPDSFIIFYILNAFPTVQPEPLKKLLSIAPDFHEIHHFLGDWHLSRGDLISAENHFLQMTKNIPDSTLAMISLARTYMGFEELSKSLDLFDTVLKIIPTYRETLLGKVLCLSHLGRHTEAIEACQVIHSLGLYYLGEANYWTAWNQNELGNIRDAFHYVTKAQYYLEGYPDVNLLKGLICYQLGMLEEAELNLKIALELDPQACEASFTLGKINADRNKWAQSCAEFKKAAACYENQEKGIKEKIEEIMHSKISAERKNRLILRRKRELQSLQTAIATALYNAAAGCFNSENHLEALELAEKAALHPALEQKALELKKKIKGCMQK